MALNDLFKLAKLSIFAFSDSARKQPLPDGDGMFEVQYNPETLSAKYASTFQSSPNTKAAKFLYGSSQTLTVALIFDGTNVGEMGIEQLGRLPSVTDRVNAFLRACYQVVGPTSECAYLTLQWGNGVLGNNFQCRLKSAEIKYTSFNRDGSPLRAELSAVFLEDVDTEKRQLMERLASSNLSQTRVVKAGDSLPMLCLATYGSAASYLKVAQANNLDDFRVLAPGQQLTFPPAGKVEQR